MKITFALILLIIITSGLISCKNIFSGSSNSNKSNEHNFSIVKQLTIPDIENKADTFLQGDFEFIHRSRSDNSVMTSDSLIIFGKNDNPRFHPVFTALVICTFYTEYRRTNDESYKKIILKNLEYVESRMTNENYIEYPFEHTHGGNFLGEKWISGMAQGEMISAFIRGYLLTRDEYYLNIADKFLKTLLRKPDADEYWCTYVDSNNYYWIEEYPNPDHCHVLNGKMFALWSVWEYYAITRSEDAKNVFQAGLRSVLDNYVEYWINPTSYRSMYCQHFPANEDYHNIHIGLFSNYFSLLSMNEINYAYKVFQSMPAEE